ncbi:HAD family hydrolase [Reinekea marina]|uniref:HAD family hydrolase n=1 Tax=Reinekea marina TaxID=1310421 RepID=A0ABV7WLW6_9GAMM|nr:HAD family hydrolase [Reinekea marina]MDN3649949.1 HAD family hydrolase [Reinekea marina]
MAKNTILIDFDGVIRHWSNEDINQKEDALGLAPGTLASVAFDSKLLMPAITGQVSHEQWQGHVETKLSQLHNQQVAKQLVAFWSNAKFKIDYDFLAQLKARAPSAKIVLVTNATSRLPSDLAKAKLKNAFDVVINSSEIGVAKPSLEFFSKTLSIVDTLIEQAVFIDDSLANVTAAQSLGIDSVQHCTTSDTLEFINEHFS